jgi:transcriptional regulator with XRE-family HTH domain
MDLGKRLRELRLEKGLNQIDVANILGIERSTYGKYETGDSSPDYEKLLKLADFYNVSTDYILGKTNIKDPIETIAAHHDGDEWTEEELAEIEKFKEFVRMKRQQKTPQEAMQASWGVSTYSQGFSFRNLCSRNVCGYLARAFQKLPFLNFASQDAIKRLMRLLRANNLSLASLSCALFLML